MKYPVVVNKTKEGYEAQCPMLPGCRSCGATVEEALANIKNAIKAYLRTIEAETKEPPSN